MNGVGNIESVGKILIPRGQKVKKIIFLPFCVLVKRWRYPKLKYRIPRDLEWVKKPWNKP
mgnify:FL=1